MTQDEFNKLPVTSLSFYSHFGILAADVDLEGVEIVSPSAHRKMAEHWKSAYSYPAPDPQNIGRMLRAIATVAEKEEAA